MGRILTIIFTEFTTDLRLIGLLLSCDVIQRYFKLIFKNVYYKLDQTSFTWVSQTISYIFIFIKIFKKWGLCLTLRNLSLFMPYAIVSDSLVNMSKYPSSSCDYDDLRLSVTISGRCRLWVTRHSLFILNTFYIIG